MPDDSGLSPSRLGALIVEGYSAPRKSMAYVLAMRPDEQARLLMVGIGIVVGALGFALLGDRGEGGAQGAGILGYVATVIAGLLQYYGFAWIVGIVCRAAGGAGDRETDRTIVAWWALVTAPLPVAMMLAIRAGDSPFAMLILLGSAILSLVLLAAYIAEAHRFHSTGRVCGAIMVLLMIFSFVLSSILPMPMPA